MVLIPKWSAQASEKYFAYGHLAMIGSLQLLVALQKQILPLKIFLVLALVVHFLAVEAPPPAYNLDSQSPTNRAA